ncbi:hypothetical protein L1987_14613 [Smallanthus sonchifolius]|uniref:Uncharacterized protein n=1 Tax=Smallanthus sonchifolius TaxID=185202 RepID=A0ACB9J3T8_9ASTR|nr:hypothetical protein L1987_14613 [Smallanthus sonchifolius]
MIHVTMRVTLVIHSHCCPSSLNKQQRKQKSDGNGIKATKVNHDSAARILLKGVKNKKNKASKIIQIPIFINKRLVQLSVSN